MKIGQRNKYKRWIKKDSVTGIKPSDGKKASDSPELILDIVDDLNWLDRTVRKMDMEDAIKWALGLDLYVRDKSNQSNPPLYSKFATRSFVGERGRIVSIELFGHFDTEFTFEHPAIVLGGGTDWIIVAPISSPCYGDGIDTHVDLTTAINHGEMRNTCAIKLESIRAISKRRIIEWYGKISDKTKLDEIDEKIAKMTIPKFHEALVDTKDKLSQSVEDLDITKIDLQTAYDEVSSLHKELKEITAKLTEALEQNDEKDRSIAALNLLIEKKRELRRSELVNTDDIEKSS
ncbi:type II toxin-antitoxin system PemK/MazF family toxin [Peribacillus butanolivorans]|uniref:type II toxin-antitoxin system PemK/MazF family toxin n=1 Tax=Peribacillus butanolivorans TaxID=421767 RepID=UPI0036B8A66D